MAHVDRNSIDHAQRIVSCLIPDPTIRRNILAFLSSAIVYAYSLKPENWNLNLDKDGKFVRFNVGQEYCIDIYKRHTLILALKRHVPKRLIESSMVEFIAYVGKKKTRLFDLNNSSCCLKKIPDSVGCRLNYDSNVTKVLSLLEEANQKFLEEAITNTRIAGRMKDAHSPGMVAFLSQFCNKTIFNPSYAQPNVSIRKDSFEIASDVEESDTDYEFVQETERLALMQSRIGQGDFRKQLLAYWCGCAVTRCQKNEILRASHIKPWREASDQERLDKYNGLLLTPNLDAVFDCGLISFDDDGKILISASLSWDDRNNLGIHDSMRIYKLDDRHLKYLRYHRLYVFKNR